MAKTLAAVEAIVDRIQFMDRRFRVLPKGDGFLLQVVYNEADVETGKMAEQRARKWYVSSHSTLTEIVETAFAACQRSMLHIVGEHFKYCGERVYSPHFSIHGRIAMAEAEDFDERPSPAVIP